MTDEIKDGLWESYYDNGQLESKGTYKDGEREGTVRDVLRQRSVEF